MKEPRPGAFPLVGRGSGVVELRGFEPLTFSLRRPRCLRTGGPRSVLRMPWVLPSRGSGCAGGAQTSVARGEPPTR
jgi:hypothetical protein